MSLTMIIGLSYLVSIPYCIWKLIKRYKRVSLDGITGYTPGLDIITVIFAGPLFMVVDLIAIWIIMILDCQKNKKDESHKKQVL